MELIIRGPTLHYVKEVQWLEVTTTVGSLIIQEGHVPLIALLTSQNLIFQTREDFIETVAISGGIMEVTRQAVSIVMSEACIIR
jgi:F0F1-type ATP synthase epsilon subunit